MEQITLYIILLLFIVVILNSNLKPISKLNLLSSYSDTVFRKITIRDNFLYFIGSSNYIDFSDDNLKNSLGLNSSGFLEQLYDILIFKPFYNIDNKKQLGFVFSLNIITTTTNINNQQNRIILDTYYLNGNTGSNTSPVIIYVFKPYKNTYNVYYGITEDYKWYKLTIDFQEYKITYDLIADKIPDTDVGFRYITNTIGTQDVESTFHIVGTDGNLYTTGFLMKV